jgi:hypothetical protein
MDERRIDFLCLGAQKAGTTTFCSYLRGHHQLLVPADELHFFDDERQCWPSPSIDVYHQSFDWGNVLPAFHVGRGLGTKRSLLRGEVTPVYIYWRAAAYRIYKYNPAMKLIVLLRNPMARAYSQWAMESARGAELLSFSESLRLEYSRRMDAFPSQHRVYSYLDRGRYYVQLMRFLDFFPSRQLLVLRSENLFSDPGNLLDQVARFLEIDPFSSFDYQHNRMGTYPAGMSSEDWQYMYLRLAGDIRRLENLLGWDLDSWRQPYSPPLSACVDAGGA